MPDFADVSPTDRYRLAIPPELQAQPYWLLWRFEAADRPGDKPRKVPYYADGSRRQGFQGSPEDVARLVTFDAVLEALSNDRWTGLGYAHVPGCGVNSLDFDNCIASDGAIASPTSFDTPRNCAACFPVISIAAVTSWTFSPYLRANTFAALIAIGQSSHSPTP
jgi:hypothetical protein